MPPESTVDESVQTAIYRAFTVVEDNMPLVFGVAIAFVAWNVGKRVLGKI